MKVRPLFITHLGNPTALSSYLPSTPEFGDNIANMRFYNKIQLLNSKSPVAI